MSLHSDASTDKDKFLNSLSFLYFFNLSKGDSFKEMMLSFVCDLNHSSDKISSNEGLFFGSFSNIFEINFLAAVLTLSNSL